MRFALGFKEQKAYSMVTVIYFLGVMDVGDV